MSWRRPAITCSRARSDFRKPSLWAQLARLALGDQSACFEFAPAAAEAGRLCDPQDQLQVAQPARAFLDVRLERVGRVLKLRVTLAHFEHLRLEERLRVERRTVAPSEIVEQCGAAGDAARFQQRGTHRDVVGRFLDALRHAAHAAAEFQPEIPREADEALDARVQMLEPRVGQQHQDVDVGVRREFAAPIAANRDQREVVGQLAGVPGGAQRMVRGAREGGHQRVDVGGRSEAFQQLGFGHFVVRLERRGMGGGDGWNATHWQEGGVVGIGQAVAATTGGRAGVPADTVSTS
ncbi:hypothetical protein OKW30_001536 [Paraburkholderia sp. Clong3]